MTEQDPTVDTTPVLDSKPVKTPLTDVDKENFFKAFISDSPFEETMELFEGKTKVKFKTLTIAENDTIFKQISFDNIKGIAKNDDSYMIRIVQYRAAGSILSINGDDFCPEITLESTPNSSETGTTYLTERLKVMEKWHTFKLGAITSAFNKFESKVRQLTEEAFKENF